MGKDKAAYVTMRYRCGDKPGDEISVTVPAHVETPASIVVRYPDEDYADYRFWWFINDQQKGDSRAGLTNADLREFDRRFNGG